MFLCGIASHGVMDDAWHFGGGVIDGAGHSARTLERLWDIWKDLSVAPARGPDRHLSPSDGKGAAARPRTMRHPRPVFRELGAGLLEKGALSFAVRRRSSVRWSLQGRG